MKFDSEVSTLIEHRFPYPIGSKFKKFRTSLLANPTVQIKQLIELFEITLRYTATLACRSYLYEDGNSKKVNGLLHNFNRPSNGNWLELLRECLLHYRGQLKQSSETDENTNSPKQITRELAKFYHEFLPEKRNNQLFQSSISFAEKNKLNIDFRPDNSFLLDLFVAVRNLNAHGASASEKEYEEMVEFLWPILSYLLLQLAFLTRYGLYYVKEVRAEKGVFIHDLLICMGKDFNVARLKLDRAPLNNNDLYVFSFDADEANANNEISSSTSIHSTIDLSWALSLSPYLVLEQCSDCKMDQVFVFNKFQRKNVEYLSYNCGHDFHPSGHLKEFENINAFLEGKISVSELFKGRTVGRVFEENKFILSNEDKAEAESHFNSAMKNVLKGEFVLAIRDLKESLKLNQDYAPAFFNLAMCQIIQEEDLDSVMYNLDRSISIDPENAHYKFCKAKIYIETGQTVLAIDQLRSALDSDPSNHQAKSLLDRLNCETLNDEKVADGGYDQ